MNVSNKSKLEDASREYNKINIQKKIDFFFHCAASPAATLMQVPACYSSAAYSNTEFTAKALPLTNPTQLPINLLTINFVCVCVLFLI
jgi:hypothetical protein